MKPALLLCFLLLAVPVHARLDETTDQIEARYGKPLSDIKPESPATVARVYEKNGFRIAVGFYEGKSYYEQFQRVDPLLDITQTEQNCLLKANGMQGLWQTGAPDGEWHNIAPNRQAEAIYTLKVFTIRSMRVENQKEADEKKREADNLKDF